MVTGVVAVANRAPRRRSAENSMCKAGSFLATRSSAGSCWRPVPTRSSATGRAAVWRASTERTSPSCSARRSRMAACGVGSRRTRPRPVAPLGTRSTCCRSRAQPVTDVLRAPRPPIERRQRCRRRREAGAAEVHEPGATRGNGEMGDAAAVGEAREGARRFLPRSPASPAAAFRSGYGPGRARSRSHPLAAPAARRSACRRRGWLLLLSTAAFFASLGGSVMRTRAEAVLLKESVSVPRS